MDTKNKINGAEKPSKTEVKVSKTSDSEETEETLFTQEQVDEKYNEGFEAGKAEAEQESEELLKQKYDEGFEAGKAEAEEESFEEISRLKKELEKPTVNQKGLFEVTIGGEVYVLKTRGKITLHDREITAKELIDNTELCEELIEEGTSLFKKKTV